MNLKTSYIKNNRNAQYSQLWTVGADAAYNTEN